MLPDTTDPASLLTIHLYKYIPIAILLLVAYDGALTLLKVIQLLLKILCQETASVPRPLALHQRVMLLPIGT